MVKVASDVPLLPSVPVTSLIFSCGGAACAATPDPSVTAAIVLVATRTRSRMERARMARTPVVVSPQAGDGFLPYIGGGGGEPYALPKGESGTRFRVRTGASGWI